MGIMPRPMDNWFIITSDLIAGNSPTNTAPKRQLVETYQVWTGEKWSTTKTDAKMFLTMDSAEEYMRSNYAKLMP